MIAINRRRTLVSALDTAWAAIQDQHPDIPSVVLTLGSGALPDTAGQELLGHFAACRWPHTQAWVPELIISGEGLRRGPLAVMSTLLHEAAHGLALTRQINDTSRQCRYHNRRYRTLATELGLDVTQTRTTGWSATTLATGTADRYRAELETIERALAVFRHPTQRAATQNNNNGTAARCGCGRQFRITTSVLDLGPITCGICHEAFIAE